MKKEDSEAGARSPWWSPRIEVWLCHPPRPQSVHTPHVKTPKLWLVRWQEPTPTTAPTSKRQGLSTSRRISSALFQSKAPGSSSMKFSLEAINRDPRPRRILASARVPEVQWSSRVWAKDILEHPCHRKVSIKGLEKKVSSFKKMRISDDNKAGRNSNLHQWLAW